MPRRDKLRNLDVAVLEGLALYGVRNKSKLAAQLKISLGVLNRRIKHLRSHFSLCILGNLYHTNIGLRKVFVTAEAQPGYEEFLYECLKANPYWLYVSQCVGAPKCLTIYGIPVGRENEFAEFMHRLGKIKQVRNVDFLWSTCIQTINVTSSWFDRTTEQWIFPWDSWLKEIESSPLNLPYTLKEPEAYPQKADWTDIMILKELEKNSRVKLKEIANMLNLSLQVIKYHYEKHVIKEQMFDCPQIVANHYRDLSPDTYYFRFSFENSQNLAKFANSLNNKPFARAAGKVYNQNQLFVQIYLPKQQLRNFIETLSKLVKAGFLVSYEYLIMDSQKREKQTISYEYFKGNNWEYDNRKYLQSLQCVAQELGSQG
jgi:DNA-binding Lrp family transcriptional regulator